MKHIPQDSKDLIEQAIAAIGEQYRGQLYALYRLGNVDGNVEATENTLKIMQSKEPA